MFKPTILFLNVFRFFFYSYENNESANTHVEKGNVLGKVALSALEDYYLRDFTLAGVIDFMKIINQFETEFMTNCNEYFS